jgi:enterochelin esterase-like enzyme
MRLFVIVMSVVLACPTYGASPKADDVRQGRRITLELKSRVFGNTRNLHVLLPPAYDEPGRERDRFPVFYFTDGVAAWDAWGVPSVVEQLSARREIPDYIFVGIDNGGSTRESTSPARDRASEYLPYADQSWTDAAPEPKGDRFPAFLFDEVMLLVGQHVRTTTDGPVTGLAGSSFGGAVALYTALKHPDRIGLLLLESPSLHIGHEQLLKDAAVAARWPIAVSIGVGTAEGDTPDARALMVRTVRQLDDILRVRAPATRERLVVVEGAEHWYDAWRARLPDALRFLLTSQQPDGRRFQVVTFGAPPGLLTQLGRDPGGEAVVKPGWVAGIGRFIELKPV